MRSSSLPPLPFFLCASLLLLLSRPLPSVAATATATAAEKVILLLFKSAVTGDPLGSLDSWSSSLGSDPCRDFAGVTCGLGGGVEKILLHNTNLSGKLSPALSGLRSLHILSLYGNRFSGGVPSEYTWIVSLRKLNLSRNALSGVVPGFLGGLAFLRLLDLSHNSFSGGVPAALFRNCFRTRFVSLSHNNLSGPIPASIADCEKLVGVDFSFNGLSGELPQEVCQPPGMAYVSVRNNSLSGAVSGKLSSCRSLEYLDIGSNSFESQVPFDLLNLRNLSYFDASSNQFQGDLPAIGSCGEKLAHLDVSGNHLSGNIIPGIASCRALRFLSLESNRLGGSIPATLGGFTRLEFLDLSENSLAGPIPESLGNLTHLTHLNLSSNSLSGAIPSGEALQRFGPAAFAHNPGLCGPPLDTPCPATPVPVSGRFRRLTVLAIVAITAAAAILAGVCVVIVANLRTRGRRAREGEVLASVISSPPPQVSGAIIGKLVLFSRSLPSRYEDWEAGTKALLDKDRLVGGGTLGTVFKATFEGGISIAVKKLETLGSIRTQEEFEQEMGRLGSLRHPNLVALQGYYWSSNMQLILSEFIPNGNLHQQLHTPGSGGRRGGFSWPRRYRVALGTARALAYLHHDCKPQVLHLNIKSTNILLDDNYEARLSDFGLGKLLPMLGGAHGLTKFHRAAGYVAPELADPSTRLIDRCDVYSFGVVCLELVTGRKPVDRGPRGADVVVLREYVRATVETGRGPDCLDRAVEGFAENELMQVLRLGLICTSDAPTRRPSMAEVVQFLESIKPASEA